MDFVAFATNYVSQITIVIKLELAKYYKDSKMTAFISEMSRNSK